MLKFGRLKIERRSLLIVPPRKFAGTWHGCNVSVVSGSFEAPFPNGFLGIITGDDPELLRKAICDRIDKISAQLDHWDKRISSSPVDREW